MISEVKNMDCMDYMRTIPDKFFELAIVDPPYGIGESKRSNYHPNASTKYKPKKWDNNVPSSEYWNELFRVSKNQIVWGGNYFDLPPVPKWIVWDKMQPEGIDQAMFELAWQSQNNKQSMIFRRSPAQDNNKVSNGDKRNRIQRMRIHPTQKPVALYKWLLHNFACEKGRLENPEGDKIFDSHLGSGSSRIAAYDMGFDFYATELDKDYFEAQEKRFKNHIAQLKIFA